jgi:hypothetical protein
MSGNLAVCDFHAAGFVPAPREIVERMRRRDFLVKNRLATDAHQPGSRLVLVRALIFSILRASPGPARHVLLGNPAQRR